MANHVRTLREYGPNPGGGTNNPLLRVVTETTDLDTGACVRTFVKHDGGQEKPAERFTRPPEELFGIKRQVARETLRGVDPTALTQDTLKTYLRNRAIADGLLEQ